MGGERKQWLSRATLRADRMVDNYGYVGNLMARGGGQLDWGGGAPVREKGDHNELFGVWER